jgi:hypothetical protein
MEEFITLAREDLDIARLLLKENKYSNAFYHYHQSVEKTIKYVGLSSGGINEKQLLEIKHDPLKVFSKLLKHFHNFSDGYIPKSDPHTIINLRQLIDNTSDEEFINGIRNNLIQIKETPLLINESNFPSPFEALYDYAIKAGVKFDFNLDNDSFRQYAATNLRISSINLIRTINYGTKTLLILLMNSTVCIRYTPDQLRYPTKGIKNPVDFFSKDHLLIKELPVLTTTMKTAIEMAAKIKWNFDY